MYSDIKILRSLANGDNNHRIKRVEIIGVQFVAAVGDVQIYLVHDEARI